MNYLENYDDYRKRLGICRSHVYRMLRAGELEYANDKRPTKVTKQSVLAAIGQRMPFIASNCMSSLHYHVERYSWRLPVMLR